MDKTIDNHRRTMDSDDTVEMSLLFFFFYLIDIDS